MYQIQRRILLRIYKKLNKWTKERKEKILSDNGGIQDEDSGEWRQRHYKLHDLYIYMLYLL